MTVNLRSILEHHQTQLLAGLEASRAIFENAEAKGDATEFQWVEVIEKFLPTRYRATAGFVLDCEGHRSDFIDVVIHDRHYCPLLFEQGGQLYVPAESVYAVFEIKQDISKQHIEYAAAKGASVRALKRTNGDVIHAGGTHPPPELFEIMTGILALESAWSPPLGEPFREAIEATGDGTSRISLGCCLRHGSFDVAWETEVANITTSDAEVSLMFFLIHLFSHLQGLGTVRPIDLAAYGRSLET